MRFTFRTAPNAANDRLSVFAVTSGLRPPILSPLFVRSRAASTSRRTLASLCAPSCMQESSVLELAFAFGF